MTKNTRIIRVFTFGWSPEFVIRPLVEEGVGRDDIVVVIVTRPENEYAKRRVEEAYKQVLSFLKMAGVTNIYYREVDLEKEFFDICIDIVSVIRELLKIGKRIHKFYLTGGMRVLVLATFIVAQLLSAMGENVEIKVSREDRPITYTVPTNLLTLNPKAFTESQLDILKQLSSFIEASFEDLAVGRSSITVRKHLTKLREKGVVEYRVRGRKQVYKLTKLGELLLMLLE